MRRLLAIAAVGFLVLAAGGAAADTFAVRLVSEDATTITLVWAPQSGYGYLFSSAGVLRSRTNDPSRSSVRFAKVDPASYDVDVIVKGANGHYPAATPPAPTAALVQTIVSGAALTGTVNWQAVYSLDGSVTDPGSVRFYVDGTPVLTETNPPFGDTSGFWDSTTVANGPHVFKVEAIDDAGAVIATDSVNATVSNVSPPPSGGDQFPNPSTTGTPAGWVPQTTTSTSITLGQNGQVLQDVRLTNGASITVTGQNVTIRRVELDGGYINNQPGTACGSGLVVEDTSLLGPDNESGGEAAIRYGGYTARRVEIEDRHEGFRVSECGSVTIEDSYAHIVPPSPCGDWHGDGVQGYGGGAVTVRNVTIDMRTTGCYGTAPFFYPRNQGNSGPATIDHFLVMGQGASFRLGMQGTVNGLRIVEGSWVYFPVDVYCPVITSWEAKIVTIDSNYKVTSVVRDAPCTGDGT